MSTTTIFASEISDVIAVSREMSEESLDKMLHFNAKEGTWTCSCPTYIHFHSMNLTGYEHFCPHIVAIEKLHRLNANNPVEQLFVVNNTQTHKHILKRKQAKIVRKGERRNVFSRQERYDDVGNVFSPSNRVALSPTI